MGAARDGERGKSAKRKKIREACNDFRAKQRCDSARGRETARSTQSAYRTEALFIPAIRGCGQISRRAGARSRSSGESAVRERAEKSIRKRFARCADQRSDPDLGGNLAVGILAFAWTVFRYTAVMPIRDRHDCASFWRNSRDRNRSSIRAVPSDAVRGIADRVTVDLSKTNGTAANYWWDRA